MREKNVEYVVVLFSEFNMFHFVVDILESQI